MEKFTAWTLVLTERSENRDVAIKEKCTLEPAALGDGLELSAWDRAHDTSTRLVAECAKMAQLPNALNVNLLVGVFTAPDQVYMVPLDALLSSEGQQVLNHIQLRWDGREPIHAVLAVAEKTMPAHDVLPRLSSLLGLAGLPCQTVRLVQVQGEQVRCETVALHLAPIPTSNKVC